MLREIRFYGKAAKKYGPVHFVDADTMFMVVRGLVHKFGVKFRQFVKQNNWRIRKDTKSEANAITNIGVHHELGATALLHMTPVIAGASSVLRIVIGIVLLVAAYYFDSPQLAAMGATMILGGIAAMLAPTPQNGGSETSYNFSGPQNNTDQGGPVPLIYGKVGNIGGTLISAGIQYERI